MRLEAHPAACNGENSEPPDCFIKLSSEPKKRTKGADLLRFFADGGLNGIVAGSRKTGSLAERTPPANLGWHRLVCGVHWTHDGSGPQNSRTGSVTSGR